MTTQDPALPVGNEQMPERLIKAGAELVAEVHALRVSVDRQARVGKVAIVVGLALSLVFGVVMLDNRDRVCDLVTLNIPGPGEAGPATTHGRDVVRISKGLADDWSCPNR
ncbi:MAG TPA: hypothetical protein VNO31_31695 [Umezawaea sp.]|nr:hypothetical protein [Umezawaea sp.]